MNQKDYFNMTQQEVADALGMNRTTVNYFEKQALEKLRKALEERGITVEDFFDGIKK
jgi:DNA-directed RNA polymerase specialized sigma24 family protein